MRAILHRYVSWIAGACALPLAAILLADASRRSLYVGLFFLQLGHGLVLAHFVSRPERPHWRFLLGAATLVPVFVLVRGY
jgi:hypothetical protein